MTETTAARVLRQTEAEAVYVVCGYLKRYLTGFSIEDGYVVADRDGVTMYTDARYIEAAEKFFAGKEGFAVRLMAKENAPAKLLQKYKSVGIPFELTSLSDYRKLQTLNVRLVDVMPAFNACMAIKTEEELAAIGKACAIAEEGFLKLLPEIREGMTERECAARLEYEMRLGGAEGTSFDTIVAFGANASVPHHETGDTRLRFGDEILIDFGCRKEGYCSDITRTFLFGDDQKHETFKELYGRVLRAHELFKEKFHAGMTGKEGDAIAREYFKEHGLDKYFTHSLGHGIGLNIHEEPRLSPKSSTVFADGMVFSDEPGVYFAGEVGIRIEDTVALQGGTVRSFMHKTDKKLIII